MTIVLAKETRVAGEEKIAPRSERPEESDVDLPLGKRLLVPAGKNFVKAKLEVMSSDSQLAICPNTDSVDISGSTRVACPAKILPEPARIRLLGAEENHVSSQLARLSRRNAFQQEQIVIFVRSQYDL